MRDVWFGGHDDMWKNSGQSRATDLKFKEYIKEAMMDSKAGDWYTLQSKGGPATNFVQTTRDLLVDLYKYKI